MQRRVQGQMTAVWRPLKGRARKLHKTSKVSLDTSLPLRCTRIIHAPARPQIKKKVDKSDHIWRRSFIFRWKYESPLAVMQERETPVCAGLYLPKRSMGSCCAERREEIKHTGRGRQTSQSLSDVYTSDGFHHTHTHPHTHRQRTLVLHHIQPGCLQPWVSSLNGAELDSSHKPQQRFPVGVVSSTKTSP